MSTRKLTPEQRARLRELFPPVEYLSPLTPFESPQYIPPAPHNLPARSDRPSQHGYLVGSGQQLLSADQGLADPFAYASPGFTAPLPSAIPSGGPLAAPPDTQNVRDRHHFASLISNVIDVQAVSTGVFLSQPITRRNWLAFRNVSTAAQVIFLDFGKDPTAESTIAIPAGGLIIFDAVVAQDDIYALSSAAGGRLSYQYSTYAG